MLNTFYKKARTVFFIDEYLIKYFESKEFLI